MLPVVRDILKAKIVTPEIHLETLQLQIHSIHESSLELKQRKTVGCI